MAIPGKPITPYCELQFVVKKQADISKTQYLLGWSPTSFFSDNCFIGN